MSKLIEYTPRRLPTMTGPAWPDDTYTVQEYTPIDEIEIEDEVKTDKKKSKGNKIKEVSTEAVVEEPVVEAPVPTKNTPIRRRVEHEREPYYRGREAEPRLPYVENPVTEPAESGNWFSRMIAPPKDELEAANNGLRWHWVWSIGLCLPVLSGMKRFGRVQTAKMLGWHRC